MKAQPYTITLYERDKQLLDVMCDQEGNTSGAAMIRKLIREEADRRIIVLEPEEEEALLPA